MDNSSALTAQRPLSWASVSSAVAPEAARVVRAARIVVDDSTQYQTVYGIGNSLEASTAYNLQLLDAPARADLLRSLFDPDEGIGMSLARITIATSDFTPLPFYSYNDLPDPGATDINLTHFSVARDEAYILPSIKAALSAAQAPGLDTLKLFASPWSPPAWMKTSKRLGGGALLPEHYSTYAKYLIRFLEEYEQRGVHLAAMTVQNEPLQNDSKYPTMLLEPEPEARVIEAMNAVFNARSSSPLRRLPDVRLPHRSPLATCSHLNHLTHSCHRLPRSGATIIIGTTLPIQSSSLTIVASASMSTGAPSIITLANHQR